MRQKRAKAYKKQMTVYNHTFKFRQPYQVIVDDLIVLESSKSSFDLAKGLKRTLQAEVKPMITQCCMQKLYEAKNQEAISQAKNYERRRCNHFKETKEPIECIRSIVDIKGTNQHRYVVATQDINIRRKLRSIPGVPLVYINRAVMVMEPLSTASAKASNQKEQEKLVQGLNDPNYASVVKENTSENTPAPVKKRGPKQPNPLSVKKRRLVKDEKKPEDKVKHKRKRQRRKPTSAASNPSEDQPIAEN
ncbi:HCR010Cp [Eremothecium sinecaudum]|uniref:U three protein 23 n=1 Tax=Eremothecium sinecaudum TaxID=45286 RepID=A0A120K221_9SACH|nr:HCR010Cp [Eremothecium sinecaudum]AMD20160.1 HCR010Cp [Eremothecium sinecaudum]